MISRRLFIAAALAAFTMRTAVAGMSYFSPTEHAALISDPSTIHALYAQHRARFRTDLGPGFAAEIEQHLKFGFAGLVAFDLKPYGRSVATQLPDLLAAPALDCDNYAILMWRLFKLLCPEATTKVAAVGWNNGAIGNHAQMHCHLAADAHGRSGGYWMVDPTVGVMLCGHDFDGIASGKQIRTLYVHDFYAQCGRAGTVTDDLHGKVLNALMNGLYRPSHLLYYYVDLDRYISPVQDFADWMTPQGAALASP